MPKFLRYLLGVINLALFGLLLVPAVAFGQTTDAATLTRSFVTSYNAANLQATTALFTTDAVVTFNPQTSGPGKGLFTGQQEIQTWLQGDFMEKNQVQEPVNPQLSGSKATTLVRVNLPAFKQVGIDFLEYQLEVTVDNGKIKTIVFIATPDTLAKFAKLGPPAGGSGQGGSTSGGSSATSAPPAVPNTGSGASANSTSNGSFNITLILIGVGSLILVACVALFSLFRLHRSTKK